MSLMMVWINLPQMTGAVVLYHLLHDFLLLSNMVCLSKHPFGAYRQGVQIMTVFVSFIMKRFLGGRPDCIKK